MLFNLSPDAQLPPWDYPRRHPAPIIATCPICQNPAPVFIRTPEGLVCTRCK